MSSQIRIVKEKLNLAITQLCETSWMFVKNPNRDFIRERKLPLREVISILLCMEGGSLTANCCAILGAAVIHRPVQLLSNNGRKSMNLLFLRCFPFL